MSEEDRVKTPTDSLAPIELDRISIEEETAMMGQGKNKQLGALLVITGTCLAGVWALMGDMDERKAYADAGTAVEVASRSQLDGFLHCLLPNTHASRITSADKLHSKLEIMGERFGKRFGSQLERCTPMLGALVHDLEQVQAPPDMTGTITASVDAAQQLHDATQGLQTYLQDDSQDYAYAQAAGHMQRMADAWTAYREARKGVEDAVYPSP